MRSLEAQFNSPWTNKMPWYASAELAVSNDQSSLSTENSPVSQMTHMTVGKGTGQWNQ